MNAEVENIKSYCRRCGGERRHAVLCSKTRAWADEEAPVDGSDTWSILECQGCQTVSFSHTSWFSEDGDYTPEGFEPHIRRELFPPAPERKMPEWGFDLLIDLSVEEQWIDDLHKEIYAAAGMNSFSLAAMGALWQPWGLAPLSISW